MKVKIKGYVVGMAYHFLDAGKVDWQFHSYDPEAPNRERVYKRKTTIEVEVPDKLNIVAAMVSELEKAKVHALAEYQKTVFEINERLSKLQAITNEVAA